MTPEQLDRLEGKIDKLTEAVTRLVLVEERQIRQGERIGAVEQRMAAADTATLNIDKKVDRWINRGMGAWAVFGVLWVLYTKIGPAIGH